MSFTVQLCVRLVTGAFDEYRLSYLNATEFTTLVSQFILWRILVISSTEAAWTIFLLRG